MRLPCLCAYCEIDLIDGDGIDEADFRVEHFHPKSDDATPHNWHLDWNNLLGCCHGGSQRRVRNADNRFTSPDNSCDVPKGEKNLDGVILNPLHLPAFPVLFSFDRTTGAIELNVDNCRAAGIENAAQRTIAELNLNAPRLKNFRSEILDKLNDEARNLYDQGFSIEQLRSRLAKIYLRKNSNQHWPAFFSSIRNFLGAEAEQHLHNIGYEG